MLASKAPARLTRAVARTARANARLFSSAAPRSCLSVEPIAVGSQRLDARRNVKDFSKCEHSVHGSVIHVCYVCSWLRLGAIGSRHTWRPGNPARLLDLSCYQFTEPAVLFRLSPQVIRNRGERDWSSPYRHWCRR